ncbi:MAG: hypothetical protein GC181_06030 [Bacteroidetes bacterium]|nr:hypothetical protein [Bacteroidota bacterium]
MARKLLIFFFAVLNSTTIWGQNQYFFGLDLGPKVDVYHMATGYAKPYSPNMKIHNDVGALFGVTGGVLLDNKYVLETGLYRSNYRATFELFDEKGRLYFRHTPVNTFTAYYLPVILYQRKKIGKLPNMFIQYGGGFSTIVGAKVGLQTPYYSQEVPLNEADLTEGYISYTVVNNSFDAKIITLNMNVSLHYPVNEVVVASLTASGRFGISGNNYVDIEHTTPDHYKVQNSLFTKGGGFQLQFGFRYFLEKEQ